MHALLAQLAFSFYGKLDFIVRIQTAKDKTDLNNGQVSC